MHFNDVTTSGIYYPMCQIPNAISKNYFEYMYKLKVTKELIVITGYY